MRIERDTRRVRLADGAGTTVHVVRHPLATTRVRMVRMEPEQPLEDWCEHHGVEEAVSGGYASKPDYLPLGALSIGGRELEHRPFAAPWHRHRAALAVDEGHPRIGALERLAPAPSWDVLQAGPLLVLDGANVVDGETDPEGFATTAHEFDQDLTAERLPRLAIGLAVDALVAIAADGRAPDDAGLMLHELADLFLAEEAYTAMNLDGGSAAVLVSGGRRLNTPRSEEGEEMDRSSPSVTAFVIDAR